MNKNFWIIRLLGKAFLVSGFFLSIYGLAQSSKFLVNISLALLAIGIAMIVINFYQGLKSRGLDKDPQKIDGK